MELKVLDKKGAITESRKVLESVFSRELLKCTRAPTC